MTSKAAYTQQALEHAVQLVKSGMGVYKVARVFSIPITTLADKVSGRRPLVGKSKYLLTDKEESELVEWIQMYAKRSMGRSYDDLRSKVKEIVNLRGDKGRRSDGYPGKDWVNSFKKRHPEVSLGTYQGLGREREFISGDDLHRWFMNMKSYFDDIDPDILLSGDRIFNVSETGFLLCPKTKRVQAPTETKRLYSLTHYSRPKLSVLCCASAAGEFMKPMVIYPRKKLPSYNLLDGFKEAFLQISPNGWISANIFQTWLLCVFIPFVEKKKKPVVLFIDGHASHIGDALDLCKKHGIILYGLPLLPHHALHIIQPLHLALFECMKSAWTTAVRKQRKDTGETVSIANFSRVLKSIWDSCVKPEVSVEGFMNSGIFPFNPDNPLSSDKMEILKLFKSGVDSIMTPSTSHASGTFPRNRNKPLLSDTIETVESSKSLSIVDSPSIIMPSTSQAVGISPCKTNKPLLTDKLETLESPKSVIDTSSVITPSNSHASGKKPISSSKMETLKLSKSFVKSSKSANSPSIITPSPSHACSSSHASSVKTSNISVLPLTSSHYVKSLTPVNQIQPPPAPSCSKFDNIITLLRLANKIGLEKSEQYVKLIRESEEDADFQEFQNSLFQVFNSTSPGPKPVASNAREKTLSSQNSKLRLANKIGLEKSEQHVMSLHDKPEQDNVFQEFQNSLLRVVNSISPDLKPVAQDKTLSSETLKLAKIGLEKRDQSVKSIHDKSDKDSASREFRNFPIHVINFPKPDSKPVARKVEQKSFISENIKLRLADKIGLEKCAQYVKSIHNKSEKDNVSQEFQNSPIQVVDSTSPDSLANEIREEFSRNFLAIQVLSKKKIGEAPMKNAPLIASSEGYRSLLKRKGDSTREAVAKKKRKKLERKGVESSAKRS